MTANRQSNIQQKIQEHIVKRFGELKKILDNNPKTEVIIPGDTTQRDIKTNNLAGDASVRHGKHGHRLGTGLAKGQWENENEWKHIIGVLDQNVSDLLAKYPNRVSIGNIGHNETERFKVDKLPSKNCIHVWGSNASNWNIQPGGHISGSGQAGVIDSKPQQIGCFGIVTTPVAGVTKLMEEDKTHNKLIKKTTKLTTKKTEPKKENKTITTVAIYHNDSGAGTYALNTEQLFKIIKKIDAVTKNESYDIESLLENTEEHQMIKNHIMCLGGNMENKSFGGYIVRYNEQKTRKSILWVESDKFNIANITIDVNGNEILDTSRDHNTHIIHDGSCSIGALITSDYWLMNKNLPEQEKITSLSTKKLYKNIIDENIVKNLRQYLACTVSLSETNAKRNLSSTVRKNITDKTKNTIEKSIAELLQDNPAQIETQPLPDNDGDIFYDAVESQENENFYDTVPFKTIDEYIDEDILTSENFDLYDDEYTEYIESYLDLSNDKKHDKGKEYSPTKNILQKIIDGLNYIVNSISNRVAKMVYGELESMNKGSNTNTEQSENISHNIKTTDVQKVDSTEKKRFK